MFNPNERRVAVIGLSCRFAGANNPEEFWQVLDKGLCPFTPMEARFPNFPLFYNSNKSARGKTYVKKAAFLKQDIQDFDLNFFELTEKEAVSMDVQQRLLLEASYEAVEDAGVSIYGSDTSVFIGAFGQDDLIKSASLDNQYYVNSSEATGKSLAMLSNKISYFYDLHGPSISIDTACSSSLAALHYACDSIINGGCEMSLCGGVSAFTDMALFISLSKGSFLSPTSLCHAFGKDADGYARGEGVGILVLKDLDAAIRDGDRIYCEIFKTQLNHDGKTKGITLPSVSGQIDLLNKVYGKNKTLIDGIGYLEAHGTGTQAGDKAELEALSQVFRARENEQLIIGSVKTNIGHSEAAAGIAGLIKCILILKNKKIPKTLHSEEVNPIISAPGYNIRLANEHLPLDKAANGNYYIGVNSFGYGGTNAHAVITDVKTPKLDRKIEDVKSIFMLSAKSRASLQKQASIYADSLRGANLAGFSLEEICSCAALRRSHYEYRLAVAAKSRDQLIKSLENFGDSKEYPDLTYWHVNILSERKCALVFSGMGAQHEDMGKELYRDFKVFREAFDQCSLIFNKISGINLCEIMNAPEKNNDFFRPQIIQPFTLAYQIALVDLIKSFGLSFDAVIGHSAGEMAAFYCAGLVSVEEVFEIIYNRSRLHDKLYGKGKMLVLGVNRAYAEQICAEYEGVCVAVMNNRENIVLSGDERAISEIKKRMDENGVFSKFLDVDLAYHGFQMDCVKDEFISSVSGLKPSECKPETVIYSTTRKGVLAADEYNHLYWWENMRNTVEFFETIKTMSRDGYINFIEIGAKRALGYYIADICASENNECNQIILQSKDYSQTDSIYRALTQMYCRGFSINFKKLFEEGSWIDLPKYCWDKTSLKPIESQRHFITGFEPSMLLGRKMNLPFQSWEAIVNLDCCKYLKGHMLEEGVVFPAAGYIEMLIEAGIDAVREFEINSVLPLYADEDTVLQTSILKDSDIFVSVTDELRKGWTDKCLAKITQRSPLHNLDLEALKSNWHMRLDKASVYKILREKSYYYENGFAAIKEAYLLDKSALCRLEIQEDIKPARNIYAIDSMLQAAAIGLRRDLKSDREYVYYPNKVEKISINLDDFNDAYEESKELYVYMRIIKDDWEVEADSFLTDERGKVLVVLEGARFAPRLRASHLRKEDSSIYRSVWKELGEKRDDSETKSLVFTAGADYESDCMKIIDLVKTAEHERVALTVVTLNSVSVIETDCVKNYKQHVLRGLCRSLRLEHSNISIKLLDTDNPKIDPDSIINAYPDENELAVRLNAVYGLRIIEDELRPQDTSLDESAIEGVAAITGGSGGLAYNMALYLAGKGVKSIALISRHESEQTSILLDVLKYYGIRAGFYAADVSIMPELERAWSNIEKDLGSITQVYHMAGLLRDTLAVNLNLQMLRDVFRPKIEGSINVCALQNNNTSVTFVSSAAGLIGNPGQSAYSAANAFLHSYCEYCNTKNVRMIGFGALDIGMAAGVRRILEKKSFALMNADKAIALAHNTDAACAYIMEINWKEFLKEAIFSKDIRFANFADKAKLVEQSLRDKLVFDDYAACMNILEDFLIKVYAEVLEKPEESIVVNRAVQTMGIDSLASIMIALKINDELDASIAYGQVSGEYSIKDLAKEIYKNIFKDVSL